MVKNKNPWIQDEVKPELRQWEDFYRDRWQHDKVVRSTHGVNCTGSCTWNIYVKNGIVTWEMQGTDYPSMGEKLPPYEPRGCQRGISFSWYMYSPIRVKYPYIRGVLLDLWKAAKAKHPDPVDAWQSMVSDPEARKQWQRARGKGGLRRTQWDTVLEIMAAANVHTIKKHGPDRIAGFSPIPAMSMVSYASGSRMMQLMGGSSLSFYDWYCDLPNASPETWGEQTDVAESADWFNAKFIAAVGSNVGMTRTPDCHFAAEARTNGSKLTVFSPDFNMTAKFADDWFAINAGQDGAWWMAANHVILSEFHHKKQVPYFIDYAKRYTDSPYLVELTEGENGAFEAGQLLRANRLQPYQETEKGDWKFLMWDELENKPKMPMGSMGFRWGSEKGKWNLELKDGADHSEINPELTFLNQNDGTVSVRLDNFSEEVDIHRSVPIRHVEGADGNKVTVATIYDVLMAQYGVNRGLEGDYPSDYNDSNAPYTPAWSEKYTGVSRKDLIRFAREWATTAEHSKGKCTIIIGAGINHWYHANLMYRAGIHALMFCGCVGVNGGGLAHYVGQEKLAPMESWSSIAMAKDWHGPSRLQNAPSWHYVNSDQWRYEKDFTDYTTVPAKQRSASFAQGHTMDTQIRAVRNGWLPFYPQFNKNPIDLVKEAESSGATDSKDIVTHVVEQLKSKKLKFSVEDPDAPENWPRVWYIWRGNALMSSAKGHEYFLKHYLGTHHNAIADESLAKDSVKDVVWHDKAPEGKLDLVVDLNFRMDTSALYSDIILPAATWYEKNDLNSTDMHSFIHPLTEAVKPCWESKSDWQIFKEIAKKFSELAEVHLPEPVKDIVAVPLSHDSPAEIAQTEMKDWIHGEVEAIPGKTMPNFVVIERNYKDLYKRFISYGRSVREKGLGAHGTSYAIDDFYDELVESRRTETWEGTTYPSLSDDVDVCDTILRLATTTNGELAYRSYKNMEEKVGRPLAHLAEKNRDRRLDFKDLQGRPQRLINSPMWSGQIEEGRAYAPFTYNVENMVPWRTLTGRQHFYLDHQAYIDFGEHLPTYKAKPQPKVFSDLMFSESKEGGKADTKTLMLNYITPHGKWSIHSTYGDTERMLTMSRGGEPLWINDKDAEAIGLVDNDWVEVNNDHGVVVTRVNVTARLPRGICFIYHSPERTIGVPKSPLRGNKRAGGHNSLTRVRLKPNLMIGGYGQFTYHFNYWGPTGGNRDTHVLVRKLNKVDW